MNTEIAKLERLIKMWRQSYYVRHTSIIEDAEYDMYVERLRALDPKNPLLDEVGSDLSPESKKVAHPYPMLSLENVYEEEGSGGLKAAIERTVDLVCQIEQKSSGKFDIKKAIVIEPKFDGVSLELHYFNGILLYALTRGDGIFGEDVTENVLRFKLAPAYVKKFEAYSTVILRGEVVISKEDFRQICEEEGQKFAHPRNLAAGTLKLKEGGENRKLRLIVYEVNCPGIVSSLDSFWKLSDDLPVVFPWEVPSAADPPYVKWLIRRLYKEINDYEFPCDGLVVKANEFSVREEFQPTSHYPTWAFAIKFIPEKKETYIRKVSWQVGRSGTLTPVAVFDPVTIDGSVIDRATLNNVEFLRDLDLAVHDKVEIAKNGHIIPGIVRVVERMDWNRPHYELDKCPECGGPVTQDGRKLVCTNQDCPGRLAASIEYAFSRQALEVKGLGEKASRFIVKWDGDLIFGQVSNWRELLYLSVEQWEEILDVGKRSPIAQKIFEGMQETRKKPLHKWLVALQIPQVGVREAKKLSQKFRSLKDFIRCFNSADLSVDQSIKNWIAKNGEDLMSFLDTQGFDPESSFEFKENPNIKGKTFVITGTLSRKRGEFEEMIQSCGGNFRENVSRQTDYIILGESPGANKRKKGEELGVKFINEEDFMRLYEN